MAEFDFAEALKGNIDTITAGLGEHDDERLAGLAEAEGKGQKRSGVLKAIEAEQGARKLNARTLELQAAAKGEGVTLHTQAELDKAVADGGAEQREAVEKLGARITELEAAAKAKPKAGRTPATPKPQKPRKLSVDTAAAGAADREGGFTVAFTGKDDMTLGEALPDLEFDAGAFEPVVKNNGLLLTQPIEFPEGSQRAEICAAWLLDGKGKPVAVARLISPLPVGGGHVSRIPEKFLLFADVGAKPKKEAAAA